MELPLLSALESFWIEGYMGLYIPLTYSVWTVLYKLSSYPAIFHFANILLHAANSALVYLLLRRIFSFIKSSHKESIEIESFACLSGALFFSLHPLQTGAVCWITELKGLLATFFAFLSLNEFLKSKTSFPTYSLILFCAALLSKPTVSSFPFILFIVALLIQRKTLLIALKQIAVFCLVCVPVIFINKSLQSDLATIETLPDINGKLLISISSLDFYLKKIILPQGLMPIHLLSAEAVLSMGYRLSIIILPIMFLLFAVSFCVLSWQKPSRKNILFTFACLCFVIAVLPVLGLVNFKYQNFSIVADHYLYFPMFGMAIAVSAVISELLYFLPLRRLKIIVTCFCFFYAVLSFSQMNIWQNNETLYGAMIASNPNHYIALSSLGAEYVEQGNYGQALPLLYRALELNKEHYVTQLNISVILLAQKKYAELILLSKEWFPLNMIKAKSYAPNMAQLHFGVGIAFLAQGDFESAKVNFLKSLEIEPNFSYAWEAHLRLGGIAQVKGESEKAVSEYRQYLATAPVNHPLRQGVLQELNKLRHPDS